MIAASACGAQLLIAAMTSAVESTRGGIAEKPIKNVRGFEVGPEPSPHPHHSPTQAAVRSRNVRVLTSHNVSDPPVQHR